MPERDGFSPADRKLGVDQQTLFLARWGTMSALVWAMTPENAELRVRHQRFDRRLPLWKVTEGRVLIEGEVFIRLATDQDRAVFLECGVEVPA